VLGHAAGGLKQSLLARFRIREVCLPYLRQLASASGETTALYVRLGWYAVRIASAPGTAEVTNAPPSDEVHVLGAAYPGRVILAHLSPAKIASYRAFVSAHGLEVPKISALKSELAAIQARGFALGAPVFADPRVAVALPIRKFDQAIAALAIEGPVVDSSNYKRHAGISAWREIRGAIETLIRAQPALFAHPFEHIDPSEIMFAP
jgi:DNA-binding IclR family transcriptional regulator